MILETSLIEILKSLDELPWDHQLYLSSGGISSLESMALVLSDDDEIERDSEDEPLYATERQYQYYLGIQDLQGIKDNLQSQSPIESIEELVAAINFYHENDAFICINS
ncbi:DUF7716 domain-containing protein [Microbulbifer sp. JMSA008]|uniref:DUF7716 domain-containing protein n=1 Tax=unclassified Microbulbifer TaxID=2619833 RepID=UPI00403AD17D